jgi:hypothetical protein
MAIGRGEGSFLKSQKPKPTTPLFCQNLSFAKTVAHMGDKATGAGARAYACARWSFVRPSFWQSADFLALQKISLTPALLKTFNMLRSIMHACIIAQIVQTFLQRYGFETSEVRIQTNFENTNEIF